jgi:serine/threonine protein kinase/Tol biopolymer transport system component
MSVSWESLRELFDGALSLPRAQRTAFLEERTAGNEALRREVESLLLAHEAAGPFLSVPLLEASRPRFHRIGQSIDGVVSPPRLAAGTSLGTFTILQPIGTGGMGEVYRARDTRLDRLVAIKVLSYQRDLAPGGRERFEREARAISRLSHPRICTVHDVGLAHVEGRDLPFLVMELLDGETLAMRIARGPIPIDQSLAYAIDIVDALVAAHGQGIVHRDLKPANVMVTTSGVKLLDFGLAQLRLGEGLDAQASGADAPITSTGLVFGTVPYMSPEQLRGEKVDSRTDLFAFGALFHEMLTGVRPFVADSQAALIAAILEHNAPSVSERQPSSSIDLDRVVMKCLAKNPDDRWQTARDLKSELIWVRGGREENGRSRLPVVRTGRRRWRPLFITGLPTIAAFVFAMVAWRLGHAPVASREVARLSLNLPPGVTLDIPINGTAFDIAPDGSRIAFVGVRDGRTALFVHTLASGKTEAVPDTRDATNPMFSPDSRWVAFVQGLALKKLPADGGPVQIERTGPLRQMTWLPDGRVVRGGGYSALLELDGTPITHLRKGEEGHHTPALLPDGSLLFTILRGGFQSTVNSVAVWRPHRPEAQDLVTNATSPRIVKNDTIVFAQGRSLMAAGFDAHAMRLTGAPRALGVQVQTTLYSGAPMYAVANNGTLVYADLAEGRRLVWVDRQGHEQFVKTDAHMFSHLRLSPDGQRVAVYAADGDRDLWVLNMDGSAVQRLTSGPARDAMPVWTADGSRIYFTTAERNISVVPSDRSAPPEVIFALPWPQRIHPLSITADGKRLLTHWDVMPTAVNLRVLELGPPAGLTQLVPDAHAEHDGRLSPDGNWLVYVSEESTDGHEGQILVRQFNDTRAGQHFVSRGGAQPIWSHDGSEIFYRAEDGSVMSARVTTTPAFTASPPVRLISPALTLRDYTGPTYDVSPDGRRFLFIKTPELGIHSLTVVLNWDAEVRATLARKGE